MDPVSKRERALREAAAKVAGAARSAFLDGACSDDPALRERVEAFLSGQKQAAAAEPDPGEDLRPTIKLEFTEELRDEAVGQTLGRYKLLEMIGEGGCGVVYVAEQTEPVRRRVALKVIKLGMDTRQVVARFEAERQALAMMDHPNIAKVLDAGTTDAGRPFFVMELVRGIRISDYCDQANLTTRERLELFIKVCQAIQHAHQKGIIHRDIKPSNILVTMHDGVPVPKVIDFGIAKATEGRLTDNTVYTQLHQFIGTPAYMSPEQAEMSGLDIDTRSDIYSLGVLLYELLAGSTPFDAKELMASGIDAMRKTIREKEPPRPSTRLATLGADQLTTTAKRRSADTSKLLHQLKGDLDWIVMKCLEKDRTRRYETANGLAADITRHLTNEPVVARPPSAAYKFQKAWRRNRGMALTASAIVLVLFAAAVFSTGAYFRERNARLQAVAAESAREAARKTAAAETIRATEVAGFLIQFFDAVIPDLQQGGHQQAIKQLLMTADHFAGQLANAPVAEAELRSRIADSYATAVHEYDLSLAQNKKLESLGVALGDSGKQIAQFARAAQEGVMMWDANDTNAATKLLRIAADALGQNPPDRRTALYGFSEVAGFNWSEGNVAAAERFALQTLEVANDVHGYDRVRILAAQVLLMVANRRNAIGDQERAADQMLSAVQLFRSGDEVQDRKMVQDFVRTLWEYDPTLLPTKSLKLAIDRLPPRDQHLRTCLQGLEGISVARDGNWKAGLELLTQSVTNSFCNIGLWHAAVQLAALAGNEELRSSLSVVGLSRFASGADAQASEALVEPLLIRTPDPANLPTTRELLDRVFLGPPWVKVSGYFSRALLEFHTGQYDVAADLIDRHLRDVAFVIKNGANPLLARGWFARAMIEMRRGHVTEAREAYRRGLKLHSTALQAPGTPYTGDIWVDACTAELLRREAAKLLDEATPTSP